MVSQLAVLVGKEVRTSFTSPIAYAVIAVFVVLSGHTFTVSLIVAKQATLVHIFFQSAVQLILLVLLITMRQFAEERRSGTLQLLLTAPVREIDVEVAAKFIACMAVLLAMTSLTLVYAAVLAAYGDPDWGPTYSGYLDRITLGAALVSIGLMISALTSNQIVAAVVSLDCSTRSIDTLASLLPQPFENWLLGLSAPAAHRHLRGGCDVPVRRGLFRHPARPVPHGPGAGAALSDARGACRRASCSGWRRAGWLVALALLFAAGVRLPLATRLGAVDREFMRQPASWPGSAFGCWRTFRWC
ncbi:MAG: ABC transporter permease [Reyranellaceae bacterium]